MLSKDRQVNTCGFPFSDGGSDVDCDLLTPESQKFRLSTVQSGFIVKRPVTVND